MGGQRSRGLNQRLHPFRGDHDDKVMNTDLLIQTLENAWDADGFLGRLRQGQLSPEEAERFLEVLSHIQIAKNDHIPKRLLFLLWYPPIFLAWQVERVKECGSARASYEHFCNSVLSVLEDSLGVP